MSFSEPVDGGGSGGDTGEVDQFITVDGTTSRNTDAGDTLIVQDPTATVEINGREFSPTSIKVETNRYTQTDIAEVKGIWPDLDNRKPSTGAEIEISINGFRALTGTIDKSSSESEQSFTITASNIIKRLMREKIDNAFNEVTLQYLASYVDVFTPADVVTSGLPDITVSPDFNETPAINVVDQIATWGDVVWWVDPWNTVHIEPASPSIYKYGSEFIEVDPDAGEEDMPYNKVVVTGESPASLSETEDYVGGYRTYHMLSKDKVSATAGASEPVFTYSSKQIRTQQQAELVANALLKEFQRQRASGTVSLIGEGMRIRPFDVIEMPDIIGGTRYLASELTHRFNNDDGFITDVTCGGIIEEPVELTESPDSVRL